MKPLGGVAASPTRADANRATPENRGTSPLADLVAAARVLHLKGWPEPAAVAALETFRAQGVTSLHRRVSRMNPRQAQEFRAHFAREARAHSPSRRGDIIRLRSAARWPWRTNTGQP